MYIRSLAIWASIIPLAIANGAFRDAVMTPCFGARKARFLSGLSLCLLVTLLVLPSVRWVGVRGEGEAVGIGATWILCTVVFEFGFGRCVAKKGWKELSQAYRFRGGDIWPLVLLFVGACPFLAAKILGIF